MKKNLAVAVCALLRASTGGQKKLMFFYFLKKITNMLISELYIFCQIQARISIYYFFIKSNFFKIKKNYIDKKAKYSFTRLQPTNNRNFF
jgi:hypothetical protein